MRSFPFHKLAPRLFFTEASSWILLNGFDPVHLINQTLMKPTTLCNAGTLLVFIKPGSFACQSILYLQTQFFFFRLAGGTVKIFVFEQIWHVFSGRVNSGMLYPEFVFKVLNEKCCCLLYYNFRCLFRINICFSSNHNVLDNIISQGIYILPTFLMRKARLLWWDQTSCKHSC